MECWTRRARPRRARRCRDGAARGRRCPGRAAPVRAGSRAAGGGSRSRPLDPRCRTLGRRIRGVADPGAPRLAAGDRGGGPPVTPAMQLALGVSATATGVAGACVYHATYGVRSQWLGPTDWRGSADTDSVTLTFDDGPAEDTEGVLDKLAAANVRAAFFMIGRQVGRHPHVARRVGAERHQVPNHSYSHPIYL